MMTIEEKAKAYDIALDKLKRLFGTGDNCTRKELEYVFPELAESENELHRKWILEYLYDGLRKSDEQFKDHFKAAIAWIEKQGEQKSTWSEQDEYNKRQVCRILRETGCSQKLQDKINSWLESFRFQPHWKPTDEQIDALDFAADCIVPAEFCFKRKALKELLEQLKKLREE